MPSFNEVAGYLGDRIVHGRRAEEEVGGDPSTQEVAETVMAQAQSQTDAERKEVLMQEASVEFAGRG